MASQPGVLGRCQTHPDSTLDRFCSTCSKSACKKCYLFMSCFKAGHDTKPMRDAINKFNKHAAEVVKAVDDTQRELEALYDSIIEDKADFETHVQYIKTVIEQHKEAIVKQVEEESNKLLFDLEIIHKQKTEAIEYQVKELESHQMQVQSLKISVTETFNKPETENVLNNYKSNVNNVKQNIKEMHSKYSVYTKILKPTFTVNTYLEDVLMKGIGKITSIDNRYVIDKEDESIIVTKGQSFLVKIATIMDNYPCKLAATLINPTGGKFETGEVEYLENGNYEVKGRCDEEGYWMMDITAGVSRIKGSPVKIKVEPTGLALTIDDIHTVSLRESSQHLSDVELDTDGCILVSSCGKEVLKFNQSGVFVSSIEVASNAMVDRMYRMEDGHLLYVDELRKSIVMCTETFKEITQFGKGMLKHPKGLTVNNETRTLYVADREAQCVLKFNIDDGRLLGKVGLDNNIGRLVLPQDVTLTKEGHLIVTDFGNHKIQEFDASGKFIKTLVGFSKEDGKVWGPNSIVIDKDENMIVSSYHKLQVFDKNGVFIKRIDISGDCLKPSGISIISNRPRKVAVTCFNENNVKLFNY